jgi:hypothetical protein
MGGFMFHLLQMSGMDAKAKSDSKDSFVLCINNKEKLMLVGTFDLGQGTPLDRSM